MPAVGLSETLQQGFIRDEAHIDGAVPRELPHTAAFQGRSLRVEAAAPLPQQEAVIDTVLPADGECLLLQKTLQLLCLEHGIHHRLLFRDVSGRIAVIEDAVMVVNEDALHLFTSDHSSFISPAAGSSCWDAVSSMSFSRAQSGRYFSSSTPMNSCRFQRVVSPSPRQVQRTERPMA